MPEIQKCKKCVATELHADGKCKWHSTSDEAKAKRKAATTPPVGTDDVTRARRKRYAAGMLRGLVAEVKAGGDLSRAWRKCAGYRDVLNEDDVRATLGAAALTTGRDERVIAEMLR